jgi:phosphatidylserine decarboxylase
MAVLDIVIAIIVGQIKAVRCFIGKLVNADLDKAFVKNEDNIPTITTRSNGSATCLQLAESIARRILCYAKAGNALTRRQRDGVIRIGS